MRTHFPSPSTTRRVPSGRPLGRVAAVLVVLLLMVPAVATSAQASHWLLYSEGVEESVGATQEDDQAVIHAPGNPLHGRVNRVTAPGGEPGDGGLFLDARVGVDTLAGPVVYPGFLLAGPLGRTDFTPPGSRDVSAWYGWWNDLDGDGAIDDLHDAGCGGAGCGSDEFRWRGLASGESVAVTYFGIPGGNPDQDLTIALTDLTWFHAMVDAAGNPRSFSRIELDDGTAPGNPEQAWTGATDVTADGGLLTTTQMLVLAGAPTAIGDPTGYDMDAPGALYDVDRFEAVSPDVEALWSPTTAAARHAAVPVVLDGILLANASLATALDAISGDLVPVPATPDATPLVAPSLAKEPDHPQDDSEGRALFGGIGDRLGSGNAYPGYADGFNLYLDNVGWFQPCAGAWVPAPVGNPIAAGACSVYADNAVTRFDPAGGTSGDTRSTGSILAFEARFFLWKDRNSDTHVGNVCDPSDPEAFDGQRNTCAGASGWPHSILSTNEIVNVCDTATGKGTTFTVRPLGSWSGAVLQRDRSQTTRAALEDGLHVLTGSDPVTLRWRDTCSYEGEASVLQSRDALVFPAGGHPVPLEVVASVAITGFVVHHLGIDVGAQRVLDVDVIPASM